MEKHNPFAKMVPPPTHEEIAARTAEKMLEGSKLELELQEPGEKSGITTESFEGTTRRFPEAIGEEEARRAAKLLEGTDAGKWELK